MRQFKCATALQILFRSSFCLNVIQWQDNMVVPAFKFIELTNFNEASKLSDNPPTLVQNFQIDLVSFRIQRRRSLIFLTRLPITKTTPSTF